MAAGLQPRARLVALARELLRASLGGLHARRRRRVALSRSAWISARRASASSRCSVAVGGVALGVLDALAQDPRALDEILELRGRGPPGSLVLVRGRPAASSARRGRLGGGRAGGGALLGHAAVDVLVGERRRVDVADDDEDAGQARVGIGLGAVAHDALDGLQRAAVAQAQLLGMPGAGVAAAQLGQQRRELPAQRERHADDDELQRARRAVGAAGAERGRADGSTRRRAQQLLEVAGRVGVGAGDEHLGDRPADERVGGRAEQADDADAALGDRAVGRAEHVAAVREAEQHLFEVAI